MELPFTDYTKCFELQCIVIVIVIAIVNRSLEEEAFDML